MASIACFSLLGAATSSAAVVIAGIDVWDSATAPTVGVKAGVTATATASATGGNWAPGEGGSRGSSKDTTWGTFVGPAAASAVTTGSDESFTLTNGKTDGEITITIINGGTGIVTLENFHFDAVAFRPNAARTYAVNVLAGSDITIGNVITSADDAITSLGGALLTDDLDPNTHNQHDDIDISLTGLADNTLAPGETAIIQLAFSSGTGAGGGHHLFVDNVGISGTIPEPGSALLGLLGAGIFFLRRRR
ncbi:PEP-CTERM sorting domain-containing protein [Haloferula rosea]|uniref:PEP-CTERM sorting domain-containing protein n=1 Tax=Haloferula rosea TaxID=490093 RepID=A0A934RBI8_9BACT|nr:PEP-CTERM sorting domain-containing protein [Haloferula rosea]MBK1826572.1 PEP-CTERM sorting domain-containing protein [Haloferula rosea]